MKLNKKKVVVVSLAVSVVAILSFGTIAWFSDSDSVTNNFHVAGKDGDADDIFSVDVMEAVDADKDGVYEYADDKTIGLEGENLDEWLYDDITPNEELLKRVSTKNTGSYAQWVRMKVTVDEELITLLEQYQLSFTDLLKDKEGGLYDGWDYRGATTLNFNSDARWSHDTATDVEKNADGTYTYTFYYNRVLEKGSSAILFTAVHIPEKFTQADMATLDANAFSMVIKGEAIQADNTADNVRDAFTLVEATQPF